MSRLSVAILLSVVLAPGSRGEDVAEAAKWAFELPVVMAKKAEIGPGKFLGGATLLLMSPDSFGGYWPDYGYAWEPVAKADYCNAISRDRVRSKADVGRVRVLAEKPGDTDSLVGVEVLPESVGHPNTEEGDRVAAANHIGLTMEQICRVMDDAGLKTGLESIVSVHSWTFDGVPANGLWRKRTEEEMRGEMLNEVETFWPMWFGQVVEAVEEDSSEHTWKLGGTKGIVWRTAESDWWNKGAVDAAHGLGMKLKDGSEALLVGKRAAGGNEYWVPPESLAVKNGTIEDEIGLKALEGVGEVEIWWKKAPELYGSLFPEYRMWLVTEYAIPSVHLTPDVRMEVFDSNGGMN